MKYKIGEAVGACAFLALVCADATAQSQTAGQGEVIVEYSSPYLDSLVTYMTQSNYNQTTLEGYRVQIYSGSGQNSKAEAEAIKARFAKLKPDTKAYIIYNAPFWRVRVGDFRSRSEALRILRSIRGAFGGSYIVRDNTIPKNTFIDYGTR